jgi:hypothetical protein
MAAVRVEDRPGTLHARQFFAGPDRVSLDGFHEEGNFGPLRVFTQDLASVTTVTSGESAILCIGIVLDPEDPGATNQELLRRITLASTTFERFESATARYAGRWAMFVAIGARRRLYLDASGLKPAFYASIAGRLLIASQPGLLTLAAGLAIDPELSRLLMGSERYADAWPGELTPYPGVRQLLPNHYLDLDEGLARRFWPNKAIAPVTVGEAAEAMVAILRGTIEAALMRGGPVSMALTGGYDSRVLLACAGRHRSELDYFDVVDITSPFHEYWIPQRIASALHLNFRHIWAHRGQKDQSDLIQRNTGGVWRDPNQHRTSAFNRTHAKLLLLGNASEVCRCQYYKDGRHPDPSPELVAYTIGWGQEPVALDSCSRWLSSIPKDANVNILDLAYWELRLGNWCSMVYTALDTFVDAVTPFDCRRYYEIGLGVPVEYRCQPFELYREMLRITDPGLLRWPFNTTAATALAQRFKGYVPKPARHAIKRALKRLAGATDTRQFQ